MLGHISDVMKLLELIIRRDHLWHGLLWRLLLNSGGCFCWAPSLCSDTNVIQFSCRTGSSRWASLRMGLSLQPFTSQGHWASGPFRPWGRRASGGKTSRWVSRSRLFLERLLPKGDSWQWFHFVDILLWCTDVIYSHYSQTYNIIGVVGQVNNRVALWSGFNF